MQTPSPKIGEGYRHTTTFICFNKKISYDKISSGINSQEKGINRVLEEAAAESRRISLAIQEVAGTTSCKGVQISGIK